MSAVQSAVGADYSPDNSVTDNVSVVAETTVTSVTETAAAITVPAAATASETAVTYPETRAETETDTDTEDMQENDEIFEVTIYPEDWDEIY